MNGNRTMTGHVVGTNNRISTDGTYNFTYDNEGNRTSQTKISTGEVTEYEWDHRNRLTKVTQKNSGGTVVKTTEHSYDVYDRWVRRLVDPDGAGAAAAVDAFFAHDGDQIALVFDGAAASNLDNRLLWGPMVDQLLADEDVSTLTSAGDVIWPLSDHLGTPRDLAQYNSGTDTTTVANHRVYESFGALVSQTNASFSILIGFTGRPYDDSTGLQNNWHRWYVSTSGIWLSEDPIGFEASDANLRRYVNNSATLATDPRGLEWWDDDWTDWINPAAWGASWGDRMGKGAGHAGKHANGTSAWELGAKRRESSTKALALGTPNDIVNSHSFDPRARGQALNQALGESATEVKEMADGVQAAGELTTACTAVVSTGRILIPTKVPTTGAVPKHAGTSPSPPKSSGNRTAPPKVEAKLAPVETPPAKSLEPAPTPQKPAPAPTPPEKAAPAPGEAALNPTSLVPNPDAPRPRIKSVLPRRVTEPLPEGKGRTPPETKQARGFYERNKDAAKRWWEEREGDNWPKDDEGFD